MSEGIELLVRELLEKVHKSGADVTEVMRVDVEYRTYYICQNCYQNFVLDGLQDPDARCPFCSSKKLHVIISAEKKDQKGTSVESTS